jgi:hypothetical protein
MTDTTRSEAATPPYRDRVLALISKEITYAEKHLRPSDAEWMKGLWSLVLTEPEDKSASVQAEPTAWLVTRERDRTFPQAFTSKTTAEIVAASVSLPPYCEVVPLYAIPAPGQVSETKCLFCGKPAGENPVYDETNGEIACAECGTAEIKAQRKEAMLSALKSYKQADEDGVMCLVSRQAVDEAIAALQAPGQTASVGEDAADEIVTRLYRRFKEWSKRGFGPEDVTWCEVKADVIALCQAARMPAPVADEPTVRVKATYVFDNETRYSEFDLPLSMLSPRATGETGK